MMNFIIWGSLLLFLVADSIAYISMRNKPWWAIIPGAALGLFIKRKTR